jgi:guanylate kinase
LTDARPRHSSADAPDGRLFVVSAPSGAGKTTLCSAVRKHFPHLRYSVSATTRAPRPGERNGVDYRFISKTEFMDGIRNGEWAEWAEVHDNYYGTSAVVLQDALRGGHHVLLDIDVQGAEQIVARFPDAVTIFIMPPSMDILIKRLSNRGTEAADAVARRMTAAAKEMAHRDRYRHIVVNDDLDGAVAEMVRLFARYMEDRAAAGPAPHGAAR